MCINQFWNTNNLICATYTWLKCSITNMILSNISVQPRTILFSTTVITYYLFKFCSSINHQSADEIKQLPYDKDKILVIHAYAK